MKTAIVTFNGGEGSPKIDTRSDTEKYTGLCRTLENMIPKIFGGAEKRPGTEFISYSIDSPEILSFILAHENEEVAYDNEIVTTKTSTWTPDLVCFDNQIICHENEAIAETDYFFVQRMVCHENVVLFYENNIVLS